MLPSLLIVRKPSIHCRGQAFPIAKKCAVNSSTAAAHRALLLYARQQQLSLLKSPTLLLLVLASLLVTTKPCIRLIRYAANGSMAVVYKGVRRMRATLRTPRLVIVATLSNSEAFLERSGILTTAECLPVVAK